MVQGRGRGVFKPSQGGSGACLPLKILSVCLSACICFLSLPVLSYLSFLWSGHLACFHQIYIPHHSSFDKCSSQFKEESSKKFKLCVTERPTGVKSSKVLETSATRVIEAGGIHGWSSKRFRGNQLSIKLAPRSSEKTSGFN